MKRVSFITMAVTSLASVLLGGCASHDSAYLQQSQQAKPLRMPEGVNLKEEQNYYPSPANNATVAPASRSTEPPLTPPGMPTSAVTPSAAPAQSPSLATATSSPAPNNAAAAAQLSQNSEGDPILVVNANEQTTWHKVSKALKASDYQIVDKDRSMSSFYVLDVRATDNKITEKTPIYRVFLQPDAAGMPTRVSLMSQKNVTLQPEVAKQVLQSIAQHLN